MHMPISHSVVLAAVSFGVFANAAPQRYGTNPAPAGPIEEVNPAPAGIVKRNSGSDRFNNNNNYNRLRNDHNRGCGGCGECGGFGCGGCGGYGGGDGEGFFSDNNNQNINQNIDTNQNINVEEMMSPGSTFGRFRDFGRCGGLNKRDLGKRYGGLGCFDGYEDGGEGSNNDNQNINQNLIANQNLMATLPVNEFFASDKSTGSSRTPVTVSYVPANPINTNDDFRVNNKVDFKGSNGFFKSKRSLFPDVESDDTVIVSNSAVFGDKDSFKAKREELFSDNHNQNINQNIDTNQNLNAELLNSLSGFGNARSFLPFLGGGNRKRDLALNLGVEKRTFAEGSVGCIRGVADTGSGLVLGGKPKKNGSGSQNKNININKNYNAPETVPVEVETTEYVPVVEKVPVLRTIPTTEVVKEVERVPYLDVEVSYPCGCINECGCCPGTTNDAQAVAAPVVNNYINTESASIPQVDVKTDSCSGSDSDAASIPQLDVKSGSGSASDSCAGSNSDAASIPQLDVKSGSGSASDSCAGSNSDAASVPQLDITSSPCAKPITVVEPVTTCRTCKRDNCITLGCPSEAPVKPVECVKEIETVKPCEVVAPVVNTIKDVQPVEVIQPVMDVVQPVIEEHVKPIHTETVNPTIVNHTVEPCSKACTVHKRQVAEIVDDCGCADPAPAVPIVEDYGYVAPVPIAPVENYGFPQVEVDRPVEVPVEVNVQQPVEVRPVYCERPTCHCVRPCYRPCRQTCPTYRCNDRCNDHCNTRTEGTNARTDASDIADLEAVVAELSESTTTNCNENKNVNINIKRSGDCLGLSTNAIDHKAGFTTSTEGLKLTDYVSKAVYKSSPAPLPVIVETVKPVEYIETVHPVKPAEVIEVAPEVVEVTPEVVKPVEVKPIEVKPVEINPVEVIKPCAAPCKEKPAAAPKFNAVIGNQSVDVDC